MAVNWRKPRYSKYGQIEHQGIRCMYVGIGYIRYRVFYINHEFSKIKTAEYSEGLVEAI